MGLQKKRILSFAIILISIIFCSCNTNQNLSAEISQIEASKSLNKNTDENIPQETTDDTEKLRNEFCILTSFISAPNSVGGVDLNIYFYDPMRTIKYITFWVTPINAVGDPVQCEVKGESQVKAQHTGPTETNTYSFALFENLWYNKTIKTVSIDKIEVEFMSGDLLTSESIEELSINPSAIYTFKTIGTDSRTVEIGTKALKIAITKLYDNSFSDDVTFDEFKEDFQKWYSLRQPTFTNYAEEIFKDDTIYRTLGFTISLQFCEFLNLKSIDFLYTL